MGQLDQTSSNPSNAPPQQEQVNDQTRAVPPPTAFPPPGDNNPPPPQEQPTPNYYAPQPPPETYNPPPQEPNYFAPRPPPETYNPSPQEPKYYAPPPRTYNYSPPPQAPPPNYAPPPAETYYPPPQAPPNYPPQPTPVPVGIVSLANTEGWKTGLFDCFDDPLNALIAAFAPCVTFGQVAEIIDNGQTSCSTSGLMYVLVAAFIGLPWILTCTYRTKLRNRFGLVESPAPDWMVHCFCECCAISQAYRELQLRGLDPSIGWVGNVARQSQQRMVPPTQQTMA